MIAGNKGYNHFGSGGPVCEVQVVVLTPDNGQFKHGVIDGYLALDARTGKFVRANLPLLD